MYYEHFLRNREFQGVHKRDGDTEIQGHSQLLNSYIRFSKKSRSGVGYTRGTQKTSIKIFGPDV